MEFFGIAMFITVLGTLIMLCLAFSKVADRYWIAITGIITMALVMMLFLGRSLYTDDLGLCPCPPEEVVEEITISCPSANPHHQEVCNKRAEAP